MDMQLEFFRKLPTPKEIKEQFPLSEENTKLKEARDNEISDIFSGKSDKFLLIIGPCSADNIDALLDYTSRLAKINEKVSDKLFIIPRVYTNKPRTNGLGYKGMLHQPNIGSHEDLLMGIISIRDMHTRVLKETGFTCAEEMLYPDNHRYLSDLLAYAAIGARSSEDQYHRMVASGIGIPAGMKNPTGGDLSVVINSVTAAQSPQRFLYRGWEVQSNGNPLAHVILRGYVDKYGRSHPNYHYEDIINLLELYNNSGLVNPSVVIDANHANSGKKPYEQIRITNDIINSRKISNDIKKFVKGIMVESYIEEGNQPIDGGIYGKSITDPCLGWENTEKLILNLADKI